MKSTKLSGLILMAACLQPSLSQAVYITTGGDPAAGTAWMRLDQDVLFTVNKTMVNPRYIGFAIDQATLPGSDGSQTTLSASGLRYQISSESFTREFTAWTDNLAVSTGNFTPADGQIYDRPSDSEFTANYFPDLQIGDTIRVFAGTFMLNEGSSAFTLMDSGDYDLYASSTYGVYVSGLGVSVPSVSPVPVPAAVWLFGSGLLALVGIGRRRQVTALACQDK